MRLDTSPCIQGYTREQTSKHVLKHSHFHTYTYKHTLKHTHTQNVENLFFYTHFFLQWQKNGTLSIRDMQEKWKPINRKSNISDIYRYLIRNYTSLNQSNTQFQRPPLIISQFISFKSWAPTATTNQNQ